MRTAAEMKKDHKNWGTRGTKWIKDGQTYALEVLGHVDKHGDSTVADSLVANMPKGTKRNGMIEFMLAFGKLIVHPGADPKQGKFFAYAKDKSTDLAAAAKTPWFEFQPDAPVVEVFDAQAATISALRKIVANAGKAKSVEHGDALAKVQALLAELAPDEAPAAGDADPITLLNDVGEARM